MPMVIVRVNLPVSWFISSVLAASRPVSAACASKAVSPTFITERKEAPAIVHLASMALFSIQVGLASTLTLSPSA